MRLLFLFLSIACAAIGCSQPQIDNPRAEAQSPDIDTGLDLPEFLDTGDAQFQERNLSLDTLSFEKPNTELVSQTPQVLVEWSSINFAGVSYESKVCPTSSCVDANCSDQFASSLTSRELYLNQFEPVYVCARAVNSISASAWFSSPPVSLKFNPTDIQINDLLDLSKESAVGSKVGSLSVGDEFDSFNFAIIEKERTDYDLFSLAGDRSQDIILDASLIDRSAVMVLAIEASDGDVSIEKTFLFSVGGAMVAPTELALSENMIPENIPSKALIGNFIVTDNAGDQHTFSFVNIDNSNDSELFEIEGNSLYKRADVDLNYEREPPHELGLYKIRIRTTDATGLSLDTDLEILVQDVGEAPTGFSLRPIGNAAKGMFIDQQDIFELVVDDPDANNNFSYSLKSIGILEGNTFRNHEGLINFLENSNILRAYRNWRTAKLYFEIEVIDNGVGNADNIINNIVTFEYEQMPVVGLPENCLDIKQNLFDDGEQAVNGLYWLFYQGNAEQPWAVTCEEMPSSSPKEYINVDSETNVSFFTYNLPNNAGVDSFSTRYDKVRINPENLQIDANDDTFATTSGNIRDGYFYSNLDQDMVPYASAVGCATSANSELDLGEGPFSLGAAFQAGLASPVGSVQHYQLSSPSLTSGCGFISTSDQLQINNHIFIRQGGTDVASGNTQGDPEQKVEYNLQLNYNIDLLPERITRALGR